MGKPHKQEKYIKAFAEGTKVQFREPNNTGSIRDEHAFQDVNSLGTFDSPFYEFRIKPEREYPKTSLTDGEIDQIYCSGDSFSTLEVLRSIANAAIRRFVDDQENKE